MTTTFTAAIEHVTHTTARAVVRRHTVLVDRGVTKGGLDLGPAGGEYLLVALAGCFTSHLLAAIRVRQADVTNVRVAVTGTIGGVPERFTAFTLDVSAESAQPDLALGLISTAARGCQVMNTLRHVAPIALTHAGRAVSLEEVGAA